MNEYTELLKKYFFDSETNSGNSTIYTSSILANTFVDATLNSIINKIKKDPGDYSQLEYIKSIKKNISKESKKKRKIIISFCEPTKKSDFEKVLKEYDWLLFLKFAICILNLDDDYMAKVNACKVYFKDKQNLSLFKTLYHDAQVPSLELREKGFNNIELNYFNGLIVEKEINKSYVWSLTPKGKNLYAFFMMKNFDTGTTDFSYNEGKVNEVLEYLIEYLATQNVKQRKNLKIPELNSESAKYNLKKLTYMLDKDDSYSQNFAQSYSASGSKQYDWKGGSSWLCDSY